MVLVDAAAQGQGLGASLLKSALDRLRDVPVRLDATPAGYPLYVKQGFEEENRLSRMERMPSQHDISAMAIAGIQPMTRDDLPGIAAMDAVVFGAPRADLLRWMFEGAPDYAFVARRGQELAGYLSRPTRLRVRASRPDRRERCDGRDQVDRSLHVPARRPPIHHRRLP